MPMLLLIYTESVNVNIFTYAHLQTIFICCIFMKQPQNSADWLEPIWNTEVP